MPDMITRRKTSVSRSHVEPNAARRADLGYRPFDTDDHLDEALDPLTRHVTEPNAIL